VTKLLSCGEVATLGKDVLGGISITPRKAIFYQHPRLNHQADESLEISRLVDSARIYTIAAAEYLSEQ
jgi:acetylornithine deacetylase/succinyl-diaminopimelate desuccinylase-like protein